MQNTINQTKVFQNGSILTPVCRLAWPSLDKPRAVMNDAAKLRYMATFLFDCSTVDVTPILKAAEELAAKTFGPKFRNIRNLQMPLIDGENKGTNDETTGEFRPYEGYGAGIWYINSKSMYAPKLFDRMKNPADPTMFYAGCYVRALGALFSYKPSKAVPASKTGIGFGFQALQFVNDGEPFGSSQIDPDEVFDALD